MELTPVGVFCVVVGLWNLSSPLRLACWVAASATFSATAVFNFPNVPFGFQPYHWFGVLLVVSTAVKRPHQVGKFAFGTQSGQPWLMAFLIWGVIAAVATGLAGTSVAHMAHLLLGATIMASMVAIMHDTRSAVLVLRWLVGGVVAAACWGLLQFALFVAGIEYPVAVFNNSAGEFAVGFDSTVLQGLFPRVSSVATEPSYLVRSLVPVLGLLLALWAGRARSLDIAVLSPLRDFRVWALLLVTFLSTSTLGLVGLMILSLGLFILARRARPFLVALFTVVLIALMGLAQRSPMLVELADELLFGKFDQYSGQDRASSITNAFAVFMESPVFGGGPGLVTSHDLFMKLLSNFGVVGTVLFLSFLGATVRAALRARARTRGSSESSMIGALVAANVLLWAMDAAGGVSYQYGIFWVLLAFLLATSRARTSKRHAAFRSIEDRENKVGYAAGFGRHDREEREATP
jgi:hypothetical protein